MAALPEPDRVAEWAAFMRAPAGEIAVTKAQLRAAVDGVDDWADSNAAGAVFNAAIPQPARNALSDQQKALILLRVLQRRYQVLYGA
jgi:hypothetical protein